MDSSFNKLNEINIAVKTTFTDYASFVNNSLAVFDNKMLFLYSPEITGGSGANKIFQTDLSGDNLRKMDATGDFDEVHIPMKLGFNTFNNRVWINCIDNYEYSYNKGEDKYIYENKIIYSWCSNVEYIYEDQVWVGNKYINTSHPKEKLLV